MSFCTCLSPCCEVDVGVGIITCGNQHCPIHGIYADEPPVCFRCGKTAEEFDYTEYKEEDESNSDFVRDNDGTYNKDTNHFACDKCYVELGCPSHPGPDGWKAP